MNKWGKREKLILEKILHLKRQPLSGAGIFEKEDGVSEDILAQLKSTEGESIRIQKEDVQKLIKHAKHRKSLFILDFVNGPLLVCMPLSQLLEVVQALVRNGTITVEQKIEQQKETSLDDLTQFL